MGDLPSTFLSVRPSTRTALEKKPELVERILESKRRMLFQTWLSSARGDAKIVIASSAK